MILSVIDRSAPRNRVPDWPPLPERRRRPLHEAVLTALGPLAGRRLLDVGCGVGLLLRAAELRGAVVSGADSATERLEIASWALPDADLRMGDADALPFADDTFDVVTACAATDRPAAPAELVRVVRPGGRVALGGWVRPAGCWAETFAAGLRALAVPAPAAGPAAHSDDGLAGALRAEGLDVIGGGDVRFDVAYPTRAHAWRAMLVSEAILLAVLAAGEHPVREAFDTAVAPLVAADGSVVLPKVFRYAVATPR